MSPLVTIIVPMYKIESYIEKCATSLFEQTYLNLEFIFIDDFSPDNSSDVLRDLINSKYSNLKQSVKIFKNENNKGIAYTRNFGIYNSQGEYILQVDGDDYLESNAVELLVLSAMENNSDIVSFDYYLEWKNTYKEVKHNFCSDKDEYLQNILKGYSEPVIWNKLVRKKIFLENNIFFQPYVNYGEDYMVVPRLIFSSRTISYVGKPLYHYIRWNTNSISSVINLKNISDLIGVLKSNRLFFERNNKKNRIDMALNIGEVNKVYEILRDVRDIKFYVRIYEDYKLKTYFYSGMELKVRLAMYFFYHNHFFILFCYFFFFRFLILCNQILKGRLNND